MTGEKAQDREWDRERERAHLDSRGKGQIKKPQKYHNIQNHQNNRLFIPYEKLKTEGRNFTFRLKLTQWQSELKTERDPIISKMATLVCIEQQMWEYNTRHIM